MSRIFKGWIPTVSGRLSFSALGSGSHPSPCIRANIGDQHTRYIVCFQKRNLLDAVFPFVAKLKGLSSEFRFLCIAKSSDEPKFKSTNNEHDDSLTGRLYLFHDREMWNFGPEWFIKPAQRKLRNYRNESPHQRSEIGNYFDEDYNKIINRTVHYSSFFVNFTLGRDGVVTISLPNDFECKISKNAPNIPEETEEKEKYIHIVCSQLFFFLKDMAHNHQHHHQKTDTMVDLYCVKDDENFWINQSLRILYRKVIEFKRYKNQEHYDSALGILIYAKSLKNIAKRNYNYSDFSKPGHNDDLLKRSIIAGNLYHRNIASRILSFKRETIENFATVFGIILTIVFLIEITKYQIEENRVNLNLKVIAGALVEEPFIILACYIIYYFYRNLKFGGKIDLSNNKIIRSSLMLVQPINQKVASFLFICTGLVIMAFTGVFVSMLGK